MKISSEKGEIATTLLLLSIGALILGTGLGIKQYNGRKSEPLQSNAQSTCRYTSHGYLKDRQGNVIAITSESDANLKTYLEYQFTSNTGQYYEGRSKYLNGVLNSTSIFDYNYDMGDGKGKFIDIPIALVFKRDRDKYNLYGWECRDKTSVISCDKPRYTGGDGKESVTVRTKCGAVNEYWFIVEPKDGINITPDPSQPTITPPPYIPTPTVAARTQPTAPPADQVCRAAGASCYDPYPEACGANGTRTCYKRGTCSGQGGGELCSWGPGSCCSSCTDPAGDDNNTCSNNQPPAPSTDPIPTSVQQPPNQNSTISVSVTDVTRDGVIVPYTGVALWEINDDGSLGGFVGDFMQRNPNTLPYITRPQITGLNPNKTYRLEARAKDNGWTQGEGGHDLPSDLVRTVPVNCGNVNPGSTDCYGVQPGKTVAFEVRDADNTPPQQQPTAPLIPTPTNTIGCSCNAGTCSGGCTNAGEDCVGSANICYAAPEPPTPTIPPQPSVKQVNLTINLKNNTCGVTNFNGGTIDIKSSNSNLDLLDGYTIQPNEARKNSDGSFTITKQGVRIKNISGTTLSNDSFKIKLTASLYKDDSSNSTSTIAETSLMKFNVLAESNSAIDAGGNIDCSPIATGPNAEEIYQRLADKVIFGTNPYYNKISDFNDRPNEATDFEWQQMIETPNGIKVTDGLQELVNKAGLVDFFIDPYGFEVTDTMRAVEEQGKLVMLTLHYDPQFNNIANVESNISAMETLAKKINQLKHPVIRPWTEMNGSWYEYYPSGYSNEQIKAAFKKASQTFSDIVRREAPHAVILFNPNSGQKPASLFWNAEAFDGTCFDSYVKGQDSRYTLVGIMSEDNAVVRNLNGGTMVGWCETGTVFLDSPINSVFNDSNPIIRNIPHEKEKIANSINFAYHNHAHLFTSFLWPCMHYKNCGDWEFKFIEPNWVGYVVSQLPDIRNSISQGKLLDINALRELKNPEDRQLVLLKVLLGNPSFQIYFNRLSFAPSTADYNGDHYIDSADYIKFIREVKLKGQVKNNSIPVAQYASIILSNIGKRVGSSSLRELR